ncbi:TetR family transcriptional regulator [Pseudomonas sp. RP23018S]|uniref:TetR family transcriptional regulator n=1 Tax=Pseudomonas sp. RP23018S TaxID=3096037 RepID=UPI002ACA3DE7|nr:TetR family transcriptional regulator [Pseudomonas sp. RP23018S]MDZ5604299.1 TetR family transcriptional regulator [Pseudomonas sp. RP23018S]
MSPRAEQKLQTRQALLHAACELMQSGRGFGSISLREVARSAGIVPTGFYRHFPDMDALGLALVAEVEATFRDTIRRVRHNELELGGITDASVRIFLDVVAAHRTQFLFLAREQYGGSHAVRQAIARLRNGISSDLATDLARMPRWQHINAGALSMMADLVVKTVFATLPELIDSPDPDCPQPFTAQEKIAQQLRLIFIGGRHWHGSSHSS